MCLVSPIERYWKPRVMILLCPRCIQGRQKGSVSSSHNILFDYAVSILLLDEEPSGAFAFLMEDQSRQLFLRPSVDYYFTRLWHSDLPRFWSVLWYMLRPPGANTSIMLGLIPATVMAREGTRIEEFAPLLTRLQARD